MNALGARAAQPIVNAMTVDVEDYFHVSVFDGILPRSRWEEMESRVTGNTERLIDVFEHAGVKATFFVLGWVAERFPALVQRIAAGGHEIASHGTAHRLVYDMTPQAFREDVRRSKAVLEAAACRPVLGYRAPSYSITPRSLWALDVLIEEGYCYDASIFPIHHDRYGIPVSPRHPFRLDRASGVIIEAPASTVRWGPFNFPVAGGGYFRILPYWWARSGIAKLNRREGRPAIFYLHPWEIDPDQPRLDAGLLGRFRHYRNLHRCEARLKRLLNDFAFAPLAAVLDQARETRTSGSYVEALPYLW